jgi:hypothetical protein
MTKPIKKKNNNIFLWLANCFLLTASCSFFKALLTAIRLRSPATEALAKVVRYGGQVSQ